MRKILIVILTFCLLVSSFLNTSIFAAPADVSGTEYEAIAECLISLGIMPDDGYGNFAPQINITRGEVASILARLINIEPQGYNNTFTDVTADMEFAGDIETVFQFGIVSGGENGKFYPDRYLSYEEAVKMIVTLLNREKFAEAYGGYPVGYLNIAKRLELTKGVDGDNFTRGEFAQLLYNSLDAEVADIESATKNSVYLKNRGQKTILSLYKGINKIEGVVTLNKYTSLENPGGSDTYVMIDDMQLLPGKNNLNSLIGCSVDVYYDVDTETIIYFRKSDKNEELTIHSEDAYGYENGRLLYDNGKGRVVSKTISGGVPIIYNNQAITSFYGELFDIKDDGKIIFVDNNSDGNYDVIIIYDFKTYVVNNYLNDEEILYLKDSSSINLGNCEYELLVKNGEKITGAYIKEWSVVSVLSSQSGEYKFVYSSSDRISGSVSSISQDGKITIDGVEYRTVENFKDNYQIKTGESYQFLLSMEGNIAAIKIFDDDSKKIGYITAFGYDGALDDILKLKILYKAGNGKEKFLISETAKTITVDGERLSRDKLLERLEIMKQRGDHLIVRYRINDEEKINWLDTLEVGTNEDIEDALMVSFVPTEPVRWRTEGNRFMNSAILNADAPVLYIPTGLPDSSGIVSPDNEKTDNNYGYRSLLSLTNDTKYNDFITYKVGLNTIESCAVIRNVSDGGGGNGTFDTYMVVSIIENVYESIRDDGSVGTCLTFYTNGEKHDRQVSDEDIFDEYGKFESGDIVKISIDADGMVNGYIPLFDASEMKIVNQIDGEMYNHADSNYHERSIIGNLYQSKDGKLLITKYNPEIVESLAIEVLKQNGMELTKENIRNEIVKMCEIRSIGNRGFYIYDKNERGSKVSLATGDDLRDFINYGLDYSKVYVYSIYGSDRTTVIYE